MAPFRVHTVRFYDPEPRAIHSMALSSNSSLLALTRSDNSIEVWNVKDLPVFVKYLPPQHDVQIECICWYDDRLFTAGLHGYVHEHDIHKLSIKHKYAVVSGPAWCLAICSKTKQLAVGTEEGYVNLFNILNDTLELGRTLDKQEGRIMCLSWHPAGKYLATGSIDTIRIWDPKTGHPVARMTPGRLERNKETVVWALAMTQDSIVISGDSTGKTSFWNGETGTHVDSVQSHSADVLAVALSTNGQLAYTSGVDPTIMHFQLIKRQGGSKKWVKSLHRKISSHDVRCIAPTKENYFSGGVDSYLTVSNYTSKSISRLPPVPQDGVLELAGSSGLCLLKYRNRVEMWRLGESNDVTGAVDTNLSLSRDPLRILQLNTRDNENLVCSSINQTGNFIGYATKSHFRVFELHWDPNLPNEPVKIYRVNVKDKSSHPPQAISFFKGSLGETKILCGFGSPRLDCLTIKKDGGVSVVRLEGAQLNLASSIQHIQVVNNTAVIADFLGNVVALELQNLTVISKLPSLSKACISAITISPNEKTCVIAYSDQKLAHIDIETARFTSFSNNFNKKLPHEWRTRKLPVIEMKYIKPDLLLLQDYQNLIIIDESQDVSEPEEKVHISEANHDDSQDGSMICSSPSYSNAKRLTKERLRIHHSPNLISALPLTSNSLVCVEVRPDQIESKLPPSLKVKKFGAQ